MAEMYVVMGEEGVLCVTTTRALATAIDQANGEYGWDVYRVIESEEQAHERGFFPQDEEAEPDEAPQQGDFGACASCDAPTLRRNDEGGYQCMGCQAGEPPQNAP